MMLSEKCAGCGQPFEVAPGDPFVCPRCDGASTEEGPTGFRARLRTVDELRALPPLKPVIEGLLDRDTLAVIYGAPKSGKSFLAIDWAMSVATGCYWQRKAVTRLPVLYVVAEGQYGFVDRIDAWRDHQRVMTTEGLTILPVPVNLTKGDQALELAYVAEELGAGMVVIDTLARCAVGADENSARDMGQVVEHLDLVRHTSKAAVVVVHHANRGGTNMRGSSAIDGAADTALSVSKGDDGYVTVEVAMQKHHADGQRWNFGLVAAGRSMVLTRAAGGISEVTAKTLVMLETLAAMATEASPVPAGRWQKSCEPEVAARTFWRAKPELERRGAVAVIESGRTAFCHITATGRKLLETETDAG